MCEKVQRLIDESNEEIRIKYEKALKKERAEHEAEIARLKAELAAVKNSKPAPK